MQITLTSALLAAAALVGCGEPALGTSRFPASATYTAQSTEAGLSSQDEVHVTAELVDCIGPKLGARGDVRVHGAGGGAGEAVRCAVSRRAGPRIASS